MSILDSIDAFITGTYVVTRRARGMFVSGVYQPGAVVATLNLPLVIQPAREIARVTAGRDMREREQNQTTDDVHIAHSRTELKTREPGFDPDTIRFQDDDWYVIRCESPWDFSGERYWYAVLSREMEGGS